MIKIHTKRNHQELTDSMKMFPINLKELDLEELVALANLGLNQLAKEDAKVNINNKIYNLKYVDRFPMGESLQLRNSRVGLCVKQEL